MSCPLALGTFACHLCLLLCARSVCGARARVPDMYNNATMGLGGAFGAGGALGGDHSLGPAGPQVPGQARKRSAAKTTFRSWKLLQGS